MGGWAGRGVREVEVVELLANILAGRLPAYSSSKGGGCQGSAYPAPDASFLAQGRAAAGWNSTGCGWGGYSWRQLCQAAAHARTCAARRDAPAAAIIRVAPQQVAHGALVRHFLRGCSGTVGWVSTTTTHLPPIRQQAHVHSD